MKKISIVIPTGGNDSERRRNLEECLLCIEKQTVKPLEVIIVEQSLDGKFYNDDLAPSDDKAIVQSAISGLQLDVLDTFYPDKRIIEWAAEVTE